MRIDPQTALLAFYAIFWGVLLPVMGKFRPFGIDGFSKEGSAPKVKNLIRFGCALLILNIGPAGWFTFLLDYVLPDKKTPIFAAAIASLSVFGFLNFGYAFFGAKPYVEWLYTKDEFDELSRPNETTDDRKILLEKAPSKSFIRLGLFNLCAFSALAFLIGRLCRH
jgi:hypothetical protein